MKRIFIAFAVLAAACSCSGPSNVKDVAKKVSDPVFRTYCVAKMDLDGDKAGIEFFKSLKSLDCSQTKVKSLKLDNPSLEILKCEKNESLAAVDLSKCPALTFIYASHTSIKSLDLSSQQNLYRLWIDNTPVSRLDLSGCPRINNINVMNCPSLKELTLSTEVNKEVLYLAKDDALVVK